MTRASAKVTKPKKSTRPNVDKSGDKSGTPGPVPMVAQPHGGALRRGSLPGNTPGTGRPPNAVRATFREILETEGALAAREILLGQPDHQGRVPEHAERRNWLRELAEIGFNERLRIAKVRAEAAADAGPKAQAGVQIILQGGPAGNEQPA